MSPEGVVTGSLAALAPEVPVALVAVTVKVYSVNSDSPETSIGLVAEVPVNPPGLDVAVKVDPAYAPGAVNATFTDEKFTAVAAPMVGTEGSGVMPAIKLL